MKRIALCVSVVFALISFGYLHTEGTTRVLVIRSAPNKVIGVRGDLTQGGKIADLSWASRSSVACFPATQNKKFTGNHVLYKTELPPYSVMTITLVPKDTSANFSLYGYQVGTNSNPIVPDLVSCVTCEADHKWDYPKYGKTQDHTRSISFNAINNPYNVFIGVAGAEGLAKGGYTLKIDLKTKNTAAEEQRKLTVYQAKSVKGKGIAYKGDLKNGVPIPDLSWASRSSVACFPGTQNKKFSGNHVIYVTEIPPRSKMTVTVVPRDKSANMSIYAYMTGTTNTAMVPHLASCVTCEAEHKWDYPKYGKTQDHTRSVYLNAVNNPYRVVIGVAGADGLAEGEFALIIKVE